MAYVLQYTANFNNERNEFIEIEIYKKDGDVVTVRNYAVTQCEINCNDGDDVLDSIITRELLFKLNVPHDDTFINWRTFITSANDDWKVIAKSDGQFIFHGFIVPDESPTDFQDKPYQLTIRCTDGLKLLKNVPLVDIDGNGFSCENDNTVTDLMSYVCACLKQTNLGLQIRFYCNIYESTFAPRSVSVETDAFNNAKVDRRTFSKDAVAMQDCYTVLMSLLEEHFRLFYWKGYWVIRRIPEYQYLPGSNYFTLYNADRSLVDGGSGIDPDDWSPIGTQQITEPVNEDQLISSRFANKTVKTNFDYNVWEEFPLNIKFDRGNFFDQGDQPDDTDIDGDDNKTEIIGIYKRYTIDCWIFGKDTKSGLPGPSPTTGTAYRKSVINSFGVELYREIELTPEVTGSAVFCLLEARPVPVDAGDVVEISFQFRVQIAAGLTGISASYVYIVPDAGGPILFLDNDNGVLTEKCPWEASTGNLQLQFAGADPELYFSFIAKSVPVPKSGKMYIALYGHNAATYGKLYFKDLSIVLTPYIAGGYIPITGDYWRRTNPLNFIDTRDTTVHISDSLKKSVKGSLLRLDGETATTPSWTREGLTETRHYKELVNLGAYNLKYRRFDKIEGSFRGLKYAPNSNTISQQPLGMHILYRFVDIPEEKYYMLCTPVRMNILNGIFQGTFIEVKDAALPDGTQEPASEFKYLFNTQ